MPTGRDYPESVNELSAEKARQYLVWVLGRWDLDEDEEIYDELATQ